MCDRYFWKGFLADKMKIKILQEAVDIRMLVAEQFILIHCNNTKLGKMSIYYNLNPYYSKH